MKANDSQSIIFPLNIINYHLGIDLDKDHTVLKNALILIFRIKTFVLLVGSVAITLFIQLFHGYTYYEIHDINLYIFSYHIKTWIVLISFIIFISKSQQIRSLLADIERRLDHKERQSLRRCNRFLFFLCILTSVINTLVFTIWPFSMGHHWSLGVRELLWSTHGLLWLVASHCIVISVCYAIRLIEKRSLASVWSEGSDSVKWSPKSSSVLVNAIFDIQAIKERVNAILGFLPLLWFGQTFTATLLRLAHMSFNQLGVTNILNYFTEFGFIRLFDVLYLFSINYFQNQRPTANQILLSLSPIDSSHYNNFDLLLLHNSIHSYTNFDYKAGNIFKINNSFLFTFISTLVTFSVMFIQLLGN